jgi:hypothetical protein
MLPSHRAALVQSAAIESKLLPVKQAGQLDLLKLSKMLTDLG